jgi:hypothetical protein
LGEGSEDQAGKGVIEITATRTSTLKISPWNTISILISLLMGRPK